MNSDRLAGPCRWPALAFAFAFATVLGASGTATAADVKPEAKAEAKADAKADTKDARPATAVPPPPSGPISVSTVRAERRSLPVTVESTGTVVPVLSVDVKPQVSSVVKSVHVKEGQFVKAGELLFTLDARTDEANVERLRAQQLRDETALADLQRVLNRNRELREKNFVSQAVVETAQANVDVQRAAIEADRAAVAAARVPLTYARIVAPASGRVGAIGSWPGAAVVANQTTLLTVTQIDPIDVSFSVPQRWLQDVLGALGTGHAPVAVRLPDAKTSLTGKLVFVDNAIDAASGTVKVKARFANAPSLLWPGAFVKTTLEIGSIDDAVIVPQASIVRGPRGTFVFTVVDGKAVPRPVEIVGSRGDDAAVRGNVKPGDAIVLDGRQNLRPGWPVVDTSAPKGPGLVQADIPATPGAPARSAQ
jgi:RND family efflux transporter MFP subunit